MQKNTENKIFVIFLFVALILPILLMATIGIVVIAAMKPVENTSPETTLTTTAPSGTAASPSTSAPETPTPESSTPETPTPETPTPDERVSPGNFKAFYPEKKVIAFTFDDGPGVGTEMVLDTIEGTGDKVTFFITGYMIDNHPEENAERIRRGLEYGCEYGSHTYNHKILYNSKTGSIDGDTIYSELNDLQLKYRSITGETMHLLRPPGGNFDKNRHYGYAVVDWSVDSEDWRSYANHKSALNSKDDTVREKAEEETVEEIVEKVLPKVRSGDIILMHDIYRTSALAFKRLYAELKTQGYELVTVSELLNIDAAEYDGWYFYSTYSCGHDGALDRAKTPPANATPALPPTKIDEA